MNIQTYSHRRVSASTTRKKFSISSHVVPGLVAVLDSVVILLVALISYVAIVGTHASNPSYYAAAICFVWLVNLMLMNFAGLYRFESILRPLIFAEKIVLSFATTLLFLLAAAFSLKI